MDYILWWVSFPSSTTLRAMAARSLISLADLAQTISELARFTHGFTETNRADTILNGLRQTVRLEGDNYY